MTLAMLERPARKRKRQRLTRDRNSGAGGDPWASLWAAVLDRAISDAQSHFITSDQRGGSDVPTELERDQARKLLTATFGGWRKQREMMCAFAGVDPDALAERMAARMREVLSP